MKTAMEWGAEFSDTPFGAVLWEAMPDNIKNDPTPVHLGTLLCTGIDWESTPQGAQFWIMAFSVAMKLEKLHRENVMGVKEGSIKVSDFLKHLK